MNQTRDFQTERLKLRNINYLSFFGLFKRRNLYSMSSNAGLLGLSSQLNQWNLERVSKKANSQSLELTLEDINTIKALIKTSISKASIKHCETVYDQLIFLTIGAIQVQSQTGSDKAWALVKKSTQSHLRAKKNRQAFSLSLLITITLICLSITTIPKPNMHHVEDATQILPIETVSSGTDPVSMSMLVLAYNKMKSGTCQLPQAAMLPPEQRQAFLRFINNGVVEVNHVESLRLALGYVNCLYPQELMHPVASTGNRL